MHGPPRIRFPNSSDIRGAVRNRHSVIGPRADDVDARVVGSARYTRFEHRQLSGRLQDWSEGHDVEAPENGFEFAEVGFGKIGAGIRGAIVDATDFERQRIGLRRYQKIRAEAAEFAG